MIKIVLCIIILVFIILVFQKFKEPFNSEIIEFIDKDSVCLKLKKVNYSYTKLDLQMRNIDSKYHKNIYKYYCENLLE